MRLVFTSTARRDLIEIGDYIAKDSRKQALNFVLELEGFCARLSRQPERYPQIARYPTLRRAPYRNYLTVYRAGENTIEILRLLHAACDVDTILEAIPQRP